MNEIENPKAPMQPEQPVYPQQQVNYAVAQSTDILAGTLPAIEQVTATLDQLKNVAAEYGVALDTQEFAKIRRRSIEARNILAECVQELAIYIQKGEW